MNSAQVMELHSIQADDYVIVKKGNSLELSQISGNKSFFISKRKVNLRTAIGKPFGSCYEVKGAEIHYQDPHDFNAFEDMETYDDIDNDNRAIIDDGKSQKLTRDDIEVLKAKGISGEEIVDKLVENSSTFKNKTLYSQEKYLKKKKRKYVDNFQIALLKPSIRLLVEMYYSRNPLGIGNLRMDSLSQMMAYCNILPEAKCIVVDGFQGLLAAAVLSNLGENGIIVHVYVEKAHTTHYRQAIDALNIPKQQLDAMVYSIQFADALSSFDSNEDVDLINKNDSHESEPKSQDLQKLQRKYEKLAMIKKARETLRNQDMDCFFMAIKHDPLNVLSLLDFLSYSRPFVVHSSTIDPLLECYCTLKSSGTAINMNISETCLQNFQVLLDRTRPNLVESGSGGYILTGIKVKK